MLGRLVSRMHIRIRRLVGGNTDLFVWWMVLLVAQHMFPVTHPLASEDLVPWMMLTLSGAAFLRAKRYGYGPHPMLTPRIDRINALLQKGAAAVAPWAFMYIYYAAYNLEAEPLGFAGAVVLGVIVLVATGGSHGRTAWNPEAGAPIGAIGVTTGGAILVVVVVGFLAGRNQDNVLLQAAARSVIVGLSFLIIGLMAARIQNHRQRKAAGRKDGKDYSQQLFPATLATVGPAISLGVVLLVVKGIGFGQAFVMSLLICTWAGVVWPRPEPIMVSCVLHEVTPVGGKDPRPQVGQANAFDLPPEGALRFNPLNTKRTLVMHPWMVPVRSSRIAELDDPIRPLWDQPAPLLPDHILGDAAFEPDPLTRMDQWEVITIRLRGRDDTAGLGGGDGGSRRMVILRPFPAPGASARPKVSTYRWEEAVPADTIQVLDPTTETATLRDGDVLVLSSEGVAKAYEVEIGAPVYRVADGALFRAPQLEDYVEVG